MRCKRKYCSRTAVGRISSIKRYEAGDVEITSVAVSSADHSSAIRFGALAPGRRHRCFALLPSGQHLQRALGGEPFQHVGRVRATRLILDPVEADRGVHELPRALAVVGAGGLLDEAVLRQLSQVVRGECMADAELAGGVGGGDPAGAADQGLQVEPDRVGERPDRAWIIK